MAAVSTLNGVVRCERGGTVLFGVANGIADERSMLACAANVRFQLGSVSKQFAAAAILLLADEQKLFVDDPVSGWIDDCPDAWQSMTIRHLLDHTSGLPHWHDLPEIVLTEHMDAEVQLSVIQQARLRSAPGERWAYSSPGYWLLALIVQRAAERRYADFLAERIFEPLGLTSMFAGNAGRRSAVAADHVGSLVVPPFELDVVGMGAGDVWSTAEDVLKWDRALMRGSLLSDRSRDMMFADQAEVDDPTGTWALSTTSYGFGWFIGRTFGHRAYFHSGDNAGCVAFSIVLPDDDIQLVVLSNEARRGVDQMVTELLEPLLS